MLVPFCVSRISIHAPAKGATNKITGSTHVWMISIHAPAKGATVSSRPGKEGVQYFNPRSREGSDGSEVYYMSEIGNFNPRSREGSDSKYAQFFIMILAYLHNIITYFLIKTI